MKLNYKQYGQGPPLIILHGLLGSLDNWHTLAKKFGEAYTVYTIDQRNHGRSPHSEDLSYPLMADDLYEFMQDHQITSACLIGHSMGAKTAMQFAIHYPHMAQQLVLVDMHPFRNAPSHQTIFEALKSVDLSTLERRSDADEQLKPLIPDFGIRQFLLKNLTRTEEGGYGWKVNLPVLEKAYDKILEGVNNGTFEGPVLFLKGGRSDYIDETNLPEYQQIFPHATLKTIEESGHWIHAEAPQQFYDAVQAFLSKNE